MNRANHQPYPSDVQGQDEAGYDDQWPPRTPSSSRRYALPATTQYDVVVGHGDSPGSPTHFIALNLNATVVVIELPGGDTSKTRIYQGPPLFGPGANLYPVTLSFPDPQGDGQPDMDIHVQGQILVYLNQHGQFVPQPSSH